MPSVLNTKAESQQANPKNNLQGATERKHMEIEMRVGLYTSIMLYQGM